MSQVTYSIKSSQLYIYIALVAKGTGGAKNGNRKRETKRNTPNWHQRGTEKGHAHHIHIKQKNQRAKDATLALKGRPKSHK